MLNPGEAMRITLGTKSALFIRAALDTYASELDEILSAIHRAADDAHLSADNYLPEEVTRELAIAQSTLAQFSNARIEWWAGGIVVPDFQGSLINSALTVQLDELNQLYRRQVSNPLNPREALLPLHDRIQALEQEASSIWNMYGTSASLLRVRERRALKLSGSTWRPLIQWLAAYGSKAPPAWCFCDSTFFLETRRVFSEVDWNDLWRFSRVVLVVPAAMVRELDYAKADPRRPQSRRRHRAIKVLQILRACAASSPPGVPASLRANVEVLVLGHEPRVEVEGLDQNLPDDRLIAAALEFQETYRTNMWSWFQTTSALGTRHIGMG